MANVQLFVAIPFAAGAPDDFIQKLQAFVESLLSGQMQTGPANPVLVGALPAPVETRPASPGDVGSIAGAFLAKMGFDATPERVAMVSAWIGCEKGDQPAQWNNPMNTTLDTQYAIGSANSVNVRIYDTLDHGLDANAATLQQDNMSAIRQGLAAGDPAAFAHGFAVNPWGTGADCVAGKLGVSA